MASVFTYKLYSLPGGGEGIEHVTCSFFFTIWKMHALCSFFGLDLKTNPCELSLFWFAHCEGSVKIDNCRPRLKNTNKSITHSQFLFLVLLYKQLIYICHIISHSCSGSTTTIACWPTTCELLGIRVALILHKIWSRLSHCMLRLDENSVALNF